MSFTFGLLITIVVFSSASEGGSFINTMGDEEQDRIRDFLTSNFNIPVAYKTRLQKSAYLKICRLRKGLSIGVEGNLLYKKRKS